LKNFGLVVHKKNQGLVKNINSKGNMMIKPTQQSSRISRNKKNFDSRKKPNQEKDMSKTQCFNYKKYGHYKNHCPKLNKRK
jgi:coenzyme F420-reducing hydrogenase beta subunit